MSYEWSYGHRDLGIYIGLYLVLNRAMVYHNIEN